MKIKNVFFVFISIMLCFINLFTASSAYAQIITLYDQPQTNAKAVGKMDLSNGMVLIFTAKNGEWTKVGDPNNGNTGWIKSSDINHVAGNSSSITFTQKIIQNSSSPQTIQIIQYGRPKQLSEIEAQSLINKMRADQLAMQKSFNEMFSNMNHLFQHEWNIMWGPEQPASRAAKPQVEAANKQK